MRNSLLFASLVVAVAVGCNAAPSPAGGSAIQVSSSTLTSAAGGVSGTTTESDPGFDFTRPYFVQVAPGAHCRFRQPGALSRGEPVDADADGKAYFFPPPGSWGSQIEVDCVGGGSNVQHVSINLKDSSTFVIDEDVAKKSYPTTIVPPLVGDIDSMPLAEILSKGYPPRPDRVTNPDRYARWVDIVSSPRMARNAKMVKALGRRAGDYVATVDNFSETSNVWSGRAFDADGWTTTTDTDFPIKPNANTGTWYVEYDTQMSVPPWVRCNTTRDSPPTCNTSYTSTCQAVEWAGMGGLETRRGLAGSLVQSGIWMENISGTPSQTLFAEYAPDGPWVALPGSFTLNEEDTIETWGWVSYDETCNGFNDTGDTPMACFKFYNVTQNEYTYYGYYYIYPPDGATYYGYTFESIVEDQHGYNLADYGYVDFHDEAYGVEGAYHNVFTDPWIYIDSTTRGAGVSIMSESFSSTSDAVPYEMTWQCYY